MTLIYDCVIFYEKYCQANITRFSLRKYTSKRFIIRVMLVYTSIPSTHVYILQLMSQWKIMPRICKITVYRFLVLSIYNESLAVHSISFTSHLQKTLLTLISRAYYVVSIEQNLTKRSLKYTFRNQR